MAYTSSALSRYIGLCPNSCLLAYCLLAYGGPSGSKMTARPSRPACRRLWWALRWLRSPICAANVRPHSGHGKVLVSFGIVLRSCRFSLLASSQALRSSSNLFNPADTVDRQAGLSCTSSSSSFAGMWQAFMVAFVASL